MDTYLVHIPGQLQPSCMCLAVCALVSFGDSCICLDHVSTVLATSACSLLAHVYIDMCARDVIRLR